MFRQACHTVQTIKYARKDRRSNSQGIGTIKELFWKRNQEKEKETEGVSFKELEVTVKNLGISKKCAERHKERRRII